MSSEGIVQNKLCTGVFTEGQIITINYLSQRRRGEVQQERGEVLTGKLDPIQTRLPYVKIPKLVHY